MNLENKINKQRNKLFKRAVIKCFGRHAYKDFLEKIERITEDQVSKNDFYQGIALHKHLHGNEEINPIKLLNSEIIGDSKFPNIKYEQALYRRILSEVIQGFVSIWSEYEKVCNKPMNLQAFYRMLDFAHFAFLSNKSYGILDVYYNENLADDDDFNWKYYPSFYNYSAEEIIND